MVAVPRLGGDGNVVVGDLIGVAVDGVDHRAGTDSQDGLPVVEVARVTVWVPDMSAALCVEQGGEVDREALAVS